MKTKKTVYYILMYLPLAVVLLALPQLPEKIPAHFGFDNQVDRWGSKYEALLFPVISLFMGYFLLGMAKLAAKKERYGENNKKVTMIMGIFVLILFNALNAYFLYTSLNKVEDLSSVSLDLYQLVFGIMGVLMIVTAYRRDFLYCWGSDDNRYLYCREGDFLHCVCFRGMGNYDCG